MRLLRTLFRKKRKKESWLRYFSALFHLWLGLFSSVIVFVVCLSGGIYSLKEPLAQWRNRSEATVPVSADARTWSVAEFQERLREDGRQMVSVTVPKKKDKAFLIRFREQGAEQTGWFDPYTGEYLGAPGKGADSFFEFMLRLHRNLALGDAGRQLAGAAVLMFVVLLFTGLILWWPVKGKRLKGYFTVMWLNRTRIARDLHQVVGFYFIPLLLLISMTGLYVTYPWVKNGLIVMLGGDPIPAAGKGPRTELSDSFAGLLREMLEKEEEKETLKEVSPASPDSILMLTLQYLPYGADTNIEMPGANDPRFKVTRLNTNNWLKARLFDVITFDRTGTLKSIERFSDKPLDKQFVEVAKPLHTGELMGLPGIFLYLLASIVGCSLPVTGLIIWLKNAG